MRREWRLAATLTAACSLVGVGCASAPDELHVLPSVLDRSHWASVELRVSGLEPTRYLERRGGRLIVRSGITGDLGGASAHTTGADTAGLSLALEGPPPAGWHRLVLAVEGGPLGTAAPIEVVDARGDGGADGGADGSSDGGAPGATDAGACPGSCEGTCTQLDCGTCACTSGCPCDIACADGCFAVCNGDGTRCRVTADPGSSPVVRCGAGAGCVVAAPRTSEADIDCSASATCAIDLTASSASDLRCQSGAACDVTAAGSSDTRLTCLVGSTCRAAAEGAARFGADCRGRRCDVDCRGADGCVVTMRDGAIGTLDCTGATGCFLDACDAGARSCAGGLLACGEPCP